MDWELGAYYIGMGTERVAREARTSWRYSEHHRHGPPVGVLTSATELSLWKGFIGG